MKKLFAVVALLSLGLFAFAGYHEEEEPAAQEVGEEAAFADVIITLEAEGVAAWLVTAVEGADAEEVAELNVENATLNLEVGQRYQFDVSGVDSSFHPLDFRDADGNVLLAQGDQEGAFEAAEGVAFEATDEAVVFTLTEELAEAIATYHCSVHPPMVGDVVVAQ